MPNIYKRPSSYNLPYEERMQIIKQRFVVYMEHVDEAFHGWKLI